MRQTLLESTNTVAVPRNVEHLIVSVASPDGAIVRVRGDAFPQLAMLSVRRGVVFVSGLSRPLEVISEGDAYVTIVSPTMPVSAVATEESLVEAYGKAVRVVAIDSSIVDVFDGAEVVVKSDQAHAVRYTNGTRRAIRK